MFFFILIFISGNVGHLERSTYMTGVREDLIENDIKTAIDVECIPGDVVLFSNILIHRGGINTTDKIRWSFDWRFQDARKSTFRAENGHIVNALSDNIADVCRDGEEWVRRSLM
jgi:ectoine hydroxylase-related dioxygenase (phytanoyl-CoA dioxygenase family)